MSNAYVQVQPDGTGKKVQVFENVVGGQTVEAQAIVAVDATGAAITTQPISAVALPLPAGASTEATLALIKAKTDNLDVLLSSRTKPADTQPVSGPLTDTQLRASPVPVSSASLPLPTGAATSANQTTEIASLASLDSKLPVQGQAQMLASVPVTLASDQVNLYDRYDRRALDEQRLQMTNAPYRNAERGSITDRRARQERGMR